MRHIWWKSAARKAQLVHPAVKRRPADAEGAGGRCHVAIGAGDGPAQFAAFGTLKADTAGFGIPEQVSGRPRIDPVIVAGAIDRASRTGGADTL